MRTFMYGIDLSHYTTHVHVCVIAYCIKKI